MILTMIQMRSLISLIYFFINIGKELAEKANHVDKNKNKNKIKPLNASKNMSFGNSFLKKITNSEVINIVNSCKDDTTDGHKLQLNR